MRTLSNLKVGEYQQLYSIHKGPGEDLDKAVLSVGLITGKIKWDYELEKGQDLSVEDMPMDKFLQLSRAIAVLFSSPITTEPVRSIKVNGKSYHVCLDPRKLTSGQYIDLQHFLKEDIIVNLHKIMACLITPYKKGLFRKKIGKYDGANHEEIAEGIKELNFGAIHSTCVFFSQVWTYSIKAIAPYLISQLKKKGSNLSETDLLNIMDGSIMPQQWRSMRGSGYLKHLKYQ